jgi:hypothetical protein
MQPADAALETPSATDRETTTVSFTLLGLERTRDRGRLLGLASAEILLAGVAITVQGIRIIYEPDGSLLVQPPRFRHPDSHWLPAVILPPELANALAAEVLEAFQDASNG